MNSFAVNSPNPNVANMHLTIFHEEHGHLNTEMGVTALAPTLKNNWRQIPQAQSELRLMALVMCQHDFSPFAPLKLAHEPSKMQPPHTTGTID